MTPAAVAVLALLAAALVLMATELLRGDVVALLLTVALALVGVITAEDALSGFSRPAVATVLAVFILTSGLARTGATRSLAKAMRTLAGDHDSRLLAVAMAAGAFLSLFMQNIAAVAVLLPPLMDLASRSRVSPSKLLMPLAIGAHLGGMATLLSTSNILVAEALHEAGLEPFSLLDLLPIGLPLILVGIVYMLLVGRRSLPATGPIEQYATAQQVRKGLVQTYALRERLHEVFVPTRARAAGRTIEEARIGEQLGLSILAIVRDGAQVATAPGPDRMLRAGDTLLVAGRTERVGKLAELGLEVLEALPTDNQLSTQAVTLVEVVLAPRSQAAGRTLRDLRFRERYGLGVVALWRGGRPYRTDVGDMALRFGDALLVHGPRDRVPVLRADPDFLVLTEAGEPPRPRKAWLAAAIMGLALGAAAFNLLPMSIALVAGALAMVVTACLTMDEAYRAVEWQAIFLLAGMLPLSIALSTSGAAQWLAEGLAQAAAGGGPLALAGGMLLLAAALTQVISGQATAVVLTPIAIAAAQHAEADPRPIAVAVALGCGMAFLTPTAHSANTLVAGPGGYRFRDYLRVGLPLVLVEIAAALVLLPLFWPLRL